MLIVCSRTIWRRALGIALFAVVAAPLGGAVHAHEEPFPPSPTATTVPPVYGGSVLAVATTAVDDDDRHGVSDALTAAGFIDHVDAGDGTFAVAIGDLSFEEARFRLLDVAGVVEVARADSSDGGMTVILIGALAGAGVASFAIALFVRRRTGTAPSPQHDAT